MGTFQNIYGMSRRWEPSARMKLDASQKPALLLVSPWSGGVSHQVFVAAPPRGLWELKAWTEGCHQIPTAVVDPNLQPVEEILEFIRAVKPPVIGGSILHETIFNDHRLISQARKNSPGSLFIIGGVEVTCDWPNILPWFPAHLGVVGNGEHPLIPVVKKILEEGNIPEDLPRTFGNVKGLAFAGRPPIYSGCAEPLNLGEFRQLMKYFPWEQVPYEAYWDYEKGMGDVYAADSAHVMETIRLGVDRGCESACGFCVNAALKKVLKESGFRPEVARLPVSDIVDLIARAARAHPGVRGFMIDAETFLSREGQESILELCDKIFQRELDRYIYMCRGRTDFVENEKLAPLTLRAMEAAGFWIISYGGEHGTDRMLSQIAKGTTTLDNHRAVALSEFRGIIPKVNVIMFLPFKDFREADILETIESCLKWYRRGAEINVGLFIEPYPGTPIGRLGLKVVKEDQDFFTADGGIFTYRHGTIIKPWDPALERLAEKSISDCQAIYFPDFSRQAYSGRPLDRVPKYVFNLALFYSIYKNLGRPTGEIEEVFEILATHPRRFEPPDDDYRDQRRWRIGKMLNEGELPSIFPFVKDRRSPDDYLNQRRGIRQAWRQRTVREIFRKDFDLGNCSWRSPLETGTHNRWQF